MLWFFWSLPILLQRWCSTCLMCVRTHTDTEGKQRKASVRNILKYSKKIQYLMNTLYMVNIHLWSGWPMVIVYQLLNFYMHRYIFAEITPWKFSLTLFSPNNSPFLIAQISMISSFIVSFLQESLIAFWKKNIPVFILIFRTVLIMYNLFFIES